MGKETGAPGAPCSVRPDAAVAPIPARSGACRLPLGAGLRACEAYFALTLIGWLAFALFTHGDDFPYDVTLAHVLVSMASAACPICLIEKRAEAARRFVIATRAVVLALAAADAAWGGEVARLAAAFGMPAVVFACAAGAIATVAVAAYSGASPRARQVLCLPLEGTVAAREIERGHAGDPRAARKDVRAERRAREAAGAIRVTASAKMTGVLDESGEGEVPAERRFTWPWVRNLLIFYCIFTILGHWAEIAFCWGIVLGVFMGDYDFSHAQLWAQWLYPYPAHGIALVLVVLLLYPLSQRLVRAFRGRKAPAIIVSFFANALVCTSIDFLTGVTANADYQLWDYRDLPFNFMGQIVLQNSIAYSIAATLIVWVVYPFLAMCLRRAPKGVVDAAFFALAGAYSFLEVLYFVNVGPSGLLFG